MIYIHTVYIYTICILYICFYIIIYIYIYDRTVVMSALCRHEIPPDLHIHTYIQYRNIYIYIYIGFTTGVRINRLTPVSG